jgi:hypothetical protein
MQTIKVRIPSKLYESFKKKGFLKEEELQDEAAKVRQEPKRGGHIEYIITSNDKGEVEKEVADIEKRFPSGGYGTTLKKMYQKGSTWIAIVSRGQSSD